MYLKYISYQICFLTRSSHNAIIILLMLMCVCMSKCKIYKINYNAAIKNFKLKKKKHNWNLLNKQMFLIVYNTFKQSSSKNQSEKQWIHILNCIKIIKIAKLFLTIIGRVKERGAKMSLVFWKLIKLTSIFLF